MSQLVDMLVSMRVLRLPRIEALLGAPLAELRVEHLARLVGGGISEDEDLDFKEQLYGSGASDHRDLAGDVASLANSTGGIIVIGIRDEAGRAKELSPVPLSGDEEVRMHQIVASNVAPPPMMDVLSVSASGDSKGFFVLVVPRSPLRPHGVRVNEGFRYPRRDGPRIRYLSEHEVAAAYRARFTEVAERDVRLNVVLAEGIGRLPVEDGVWLCLALVPEIPGEMEITGRALQDARGYALTFTRRQLGLGLWKGNPQTGVGVRCITVATSNHGVTGNPLDTYAALHADGSSFVATPLWGRWEPGQTPKVRDEILVQSTADAVRFAVDHPVKCGAAGEAVAALTIAGSFPVELVHDRFMGLEREAGAGPLTEGVISRHTISPSAVQASPRELLHAVRLLLGDVLQGFGVPESVHITRDGELRRRMFGFGGQSANWDTWAPGFPVTDAEPD